MSIKLGKYFYESDNVTIPSDYTLTTGKNSTTIGTVTVSDGATLTIPDNAILIIL